MLALSGLIKNNSYMEYIKKLVGILVALVIVGGGVYFVWKYKLPVKLIDQNNDGAVCIQVITTARNPETGEIRDFPTPCDVPEDWEKVDSGSRLNGGGVDDNSRSQSGELLYLFAELNL